MSACLLLVLAGCASLPSKPSNPASGVRTISGRLSVHYRPSGTDHDESVFANFVWSASGGSVHVQLVDPLGQTLADIDSTSDQSTLSLRDGRRYSAATPEQLTQSALGWTLPLSGLSSWLDGRAAHGATLVSSEAGERHVEEDGWHITFVAPEGAPEAPPRRIDLAYPGPGPALELRIVVDQRSAP